METKTLKIMLCNPKDFALAAHFLYALNHHKGFIGDTIAITGSTIEGENSLGRYVQCDISFIEKKQASK